MPRFLLLIGLISVLLVPTFAHAQGTNIQDENFRLFNNTASPIDETVIRQAAQPLIDEGAQVVIYLVNAGNRQNFQFHLENDGYLQGETIDENVIAIYVALVSPYTHLRWGADWGKDLKDHGENIREENLNPYILEKQYTLGIIETLNAIQTAHQRNFLERLDTGGWIKVGLSVSLFLALGLALGWFKVLLFSKPV